VRRRQTPPFSLFAFQDIVTSVTGVILLVTLLVTLVLITRELGRPEVRSRAVVQEIEPLLEQVKIEITQLRKRVKMSQAEIEQLVNVVPSEVRRQLHDLEMQLDRVSKHTESVEEQLRRTTSDEQTWKARQHDSHRNKQKLQELEKKIRELERLRSQLEDENRLIYNPHQAPGKTAWLVDLAEQRILVARLNVAESPKSFSSPTAFLNWANGRDPVREYFVLLIRPNGVTHYRTVFAGLQQKSFDLGTDLIAQDQTVIDPVRGVGGK